VVQQAAYVTHEVMQNLCWLYTHSFHYINHAMPVSVYRTCSSPQRTVQ